MKATKKEDDYLTIILEPETRCIVESIRVEGNCKIIRVKALKSEILLEETIKLLRDYIKSLVSSNLDNIITPKAIKNDWKFLDKMSQKGMNIALRILKPIICTHLSYKKDVNTLGALIKVIHASPRSKRWCELHMKLCTSLNKIFNSFSAEVNEVSDLEIFCQLLEYILAIITKNLSILTRIIVNARIKYGNINSIGNVLSWMKDIMNKITAVSRPGSFYYDTSCLRSYSNDHLTFSLYITDKFSQSILSKDFTESIEITYYSFNPVILYKRDTLTQDDDMFLNNLDLTECSTKVILPDNTSIFILMATSIKILEHLRGRNFYVCKSEIIKDSLIGYLRGLSETTVVLRIDVPDTHKNFLCFSFDLKKEFDDQDQYGYFGISSSPQQSPSLYQNFINNQQFPQTKSPSSSYFQPQSQLQPQLQPQSYQFPFNNPQNSQLQSPLYSKPQQKLQSQPQPQLQQLSYIYTPNNQHFNTTGPSTTTSGFPLQFGSTPYGNQNSQYPTFLPPSLPSNQLENNSFLLSFPPTKSVIPSILNPPPGSSALYTKSYVPPPAPENLFKRKQFHPPPLSSDLVPK